MRKDPTKFRQRFDKWKSGEKVYEAGRILPEVVVTPYKKYNKFLNTLPDNLRLAPNWAYDTHRYWELNGKPKNFELAKDRNMYTYDDTDGSYHANSIAKNKDGDFEFMKPKTHSTVSYETGWYDNLPDTALFKKDYELTDDPNRPNFYMYKRRVLPKYDGGDPPGSNLSTANEDLPISGPTMPTALLSVPTLPQPVLQPDKKGWGLIFRENDNWTNQHTKGIRNDDERKWMDSWYAGRENQIRDNAIQKHKAFYQNNPSELQVNNYVGDFKKKYNDLLNYAVEYTVGGQNPNISRFNPIPDSGVRNKVADYFRYRGAVGVADPRGDTLSSRKYGLRPSLRKIDGIDYSNDDPEESKEYLMQKGPIIAYKDAYPSSEYVVHERTHAIDAEAQHYAIDRILGENGGGLRTGITRDNYWDDSDEIYSRMNELRWRNKLDPTQKVTEKTLLQMRKKGDLNVLDRYTDEVLLLLFNDVASNNNQTQSLIYADRGISPRKLPKYDEGDTTYLPQYEYETTVTPGSVLVQKHKRITNEEDWLKYWGDVGAGYVNKAKNEAAPYVGALIYGLMGGLSGLGAVANINFAPVVAGAKTLAGELSAAELAATGWNLAYKTMSGKDWSTGVSDNIELMTGWRPSETVTSFLNPGYGFGGIVKNGVGKLFNMAQNGARKLSKILPVKQQMSDLDSAIQNIITGYERNRAPLTYTDGPQLELRAATENPSEFDRMPLFSEEDFVRQTSNAKRFDLSHDIPSYDEIVESINNALTKSDLLNIRRTLSYVSDDILSQNNRAQIENLIQSRVNAVTRKRASDALSSLRLSTDYLDSLRKYGSLRRAVKNLSEGEVGEFMNEATKHMERLFLQSVTPELFQVLNGRIDPTTGILFENVDMQPVYDTLLNGDRRLLNEYYDFLGKRSTPDTISVYEDLPKRLHDAMTHNNYGESRADLIRGAKKSKLALEDVGFTEQSNNGDNFSANSIQMMLRGLTNEMKRRMEKGLPPMLLNTYGNVATNSLGKVKFNDASTGEEIAYMVLHPNIREQKTKALLQLGKNPNDFIFDTRYYKVPKEELNAEGFQTVDEALGDIRNAYKNFFDMYNQLVRKYPKLFPEGEYQYYNPIEDVYPEDRVVSEGEDPWKELPRFVTPEWRVRLDKGKSIRINPANRGKFNATKKRTGKTTEELTHSKNPLTRKRAIFAKNARKWKH